MHIDIAKKKLEGLVEKINKDHPNIELKFHQQDKSKKNMCIKGCNGSMWIEPISGSYDIGLSGKSLTKQMQIFMENTCGSQTGFKQTKPEPHHPYWRVNDFDLVKNSIYKYAGINNDSPYIFSQDEVIDSDKYYEGASKTISVNIYERNVKARTKCMELFGLSCAACKFNFESNYGMLGKGFIHIHHLTPISEVGVEYKLNPEKDLRPVCPNCHAMLHRTQPPLSISELITILNENT
ncbi:MAG: HNH endonuclease [Endozoicomonadaceae bacterium]|nr:HNH endonuclease [Endozoicomonadaceae bacterium]